MKITIHTEGYHEEEPRRNGDAQRSISWKVRVDALAQKLARERGASVSAFLEA